MFDELNKNNTESNEYGNPEIIININKIIGNNLAPIKPNNSTKLVKNVAEYLPVHELNQTD